MTGRSAPVRAHAGDVGGSLMTCRTANLTSRTLRLSPPKGWSAEGVTPNRDAAV